MKKAKILIVEDDAAVSSLLKRSLEESGAFEVRSEAGGLEVLNAARSFLPDLILLDVMLPDRDGGEVAEDLRNDGELSGVPVLFMTGALTKEEARRRGGRIGGRPFLAKPFTLEELRVEVDRLLPRA